MDYPEGDKAVLKARESGLQVPISGASGSGQGTGDDSIIGAAAEAVAAVPTAEVVSKLLKTFSRAELIDILAEMKRFAETNPIAARQLLCQLAPERRGFVWIGIPLTFSRPNPGCPPHPAHS